MVHKGSIGESLLERSAEIVTSYDTGVTLRQLFYRLVAADFLANTLSAYKNLSRYTAEARRRGEFPALIDRTRTIHRYQTFRGPEEGLRWLASVYRRDRTENQGVSIYLGLEKHGIVEQLKSWFGGYGIPILSLGGYSSQTYVDEVAEDVDAQGRPAVLIYAGDFDPSGEDIDRDFAERLGRFSMVVRVALNANQVEEFDLPPQVGKTSDSRAGSFVARHGALLQVELDALPPDILRDLYRDAIDAFWDMSMFEAVLEREAAERAKLKMESSGAFEQRLG